jgi:hypothetical protein
MASMETTPEQGRQVFELTCQRLLGHDGATFIARWRDGTYGWDVPSVEVTSVAMLLPFAGESASRSA